MKNTKSKEIKRLTFSIIGILLFLVVVTVGIYLPKQENLLSSLAFLQGESRFYMQDLSTGILLKDAVPVTDSVGMQYEPYTFKVVNHSKEDITYRILFNNNKEKASSQGKEVLPNHYLRYSIKEGNKPYLDATTLPEDGVLYTAIVPAQSEVVFEFKMWLDYDADDGAMNKVFIGKVEVEEISQ